MKSRINLFFLTVNRRFSRSNQRTCTLNRRFSAGATLVPLAEKQHADVVHEFERQTFGRLAQIGGVKRWKEYPYPKEVGPLEEHRKKCLDELPGDFNGKISKKKWNEGRNQEQIPEVLVECDMYLKFTKTETEDLPINLKEEFLKDVVWWDILLNPNHITSLSEIEINHNDAIWVEIAETPSALKRKLWQLEQALFVGEIARPIAAIACLNGERWEVEEVASYVKKEIADSKATSWKLFADIPTFVIWTPFCSIYNLIKDLNGQIDVINGLINGMERIMNNRINSIERIVNNQLDEIVNILKSTPPN